MVRVGTPGVMELRFESRPVVWVGSRLSCAKMVARVGGEMKGGWQGGGRSPRWCGRGAIFGDCWLMFVTLVSL